MDPVSPNLIAGLAVEAIKRLGGRRATAQDDQAFRKRNDVLTQRVLRRDGDATVTLMNQLAARVSTADQVRVGQALRAPEAEQLVRAVAIAQLTDGLPRLRADLQANLAAVFVLVGNIAPDTAERCAHDVMEVLTRHNREVIDQLNDGAPRQLSAAVDRAAAERDTGYLATVTKRTQVLRRHTAEDLRTFLHFADRYRMQVHRSTGHIVPAYFETRKRVSIESLHVPPTFDSEYGVETFDRLLRRVRPEYDRVVVLGDPGAGKSTVAQRIVYEHSRGKFGEADTRVPFVVTIRDYEKRRNGGGCSILDHLTGWIREQYHLEIPEGAVEYFLATGRAFVVFDGLDELQEVGRRSDMVLAIESFVALFPATPVLATSRQVGYREAPLPEATFREMRLRRFSFDDIATYAHRWFSLDETLNVREQQSVADAFLRESYLIDDIRANPMMLSLLCNVYRGARSIPRNRADLYGRCAQMLFERWDAQRGIDSGGVLKADARGALQDVALWTFRNHRGADRILERELRKRLVDYWMEHRLEDRLRAEDEADGLMESWRGRAWVLTDVGIVSSPAGEQRAYRFTHQTFLEYFAAVELVRRHPSPSELWAVLESRLRQSEWDIVAQVAIQLLEDGYYGGKEQFLSLLLERAGDPAAPQGDRINLLEFAIRNLDALAPAPKVQRHAARVAVELAVTAQPTFNDATEFDSDDDPSTAPEPALLDDGARGATVDVLLSGLLSPGETGEFYRDETLRHLVALTTSADDTVSAKAFVIGGNLDLLAPAPETTGLLDMTAAVVAAAPLRDTVRRRWRVWAGVTYFVATTALRHGLISQVDFARAAPTAALLLDLVPVTGGLAQPPPTPPVGLRWLRRYLELPPERRLDESDSDSGHVDSALADVEEPLRELGRRLLRSPTPHFGTDWFSSHGFLPSITRRLRGVGERDPYLLDIDTAAPLDHDPAALYGSAVVLCAFLERATDVRSLNLLSQFTTLALGPLQPLETVFRARFDPMLVGEARRTLYRSPLPSVARQRLASWAGRNLDFTS